MFYPYQPLFYLNLLHDQHRYYTDLLSQSHQTLGRQYQRLAEIELAIAQRHESYMPRKQKKQLQWSRAKTKKLIQDIERQQSYLIGYVRQCEDLISSYSNAGRSMRLLPQAPYPVTPFSPMPTIGSAGDMGKFEEPTKYWDLSMLPEGGESAASIPSADSGFYEPSVFTHPVPLNIGEISPQATALSPQSQPRHDFFASENDTIGELGTATAQTKVGAEIQGSRRQRRYSENAIQLIESRLASLKTHSRARSVG